MSTITLREDSKIKVRTVIGRSDHPMDGLLLIPLMHAHGYPGNCSLTTGCDGTIRHLIVAEIDGEFPVLLSACGPCYERGTIVAK
jgi:hypothetical protein